MKIELIDIESLKGFKKEEFLLEPYRYGFKSLVYYREQIGKEALSKAKEMAQHINFMAVAKVTIDENQFFLAEGCNKGRCEKFIVLNAAESSKGIHAVTLNCGRGALTDYLLEKRIEYKKGEIF